MPLVLGAVLARSPSRGFLCDLGWLLLLMLYVLLGTNSVPFHGDEATLITMSRDYHYQFIEGDLDEVRYHAPARNRDEQLLRLLNGSVSKYLIGMAWHLAGYTVDRLNGRWRWAMGFDQNLEQGNRPGDALLGVARWPMALLTALSVPLAFALGRGLGGRPAAYSASFLLGTHPVVLVQGRRATMEAPLLFFGLLTVWLAVVCARQWRRQGDLPGGRWWMAALGLGAASGLAVASKHNGVVPVAASYLALGSLLLWRFRRRRARRFAGLGASAVLGFGVFLALNPAWWDAPMGRALDVLQLRRAAVDVQAVAYPGTLYPDGSARVGGLLQQLSTASTQYYEDPSWAKPLAEPVRAYRASPWTGIPYGEHAPLGLALLAATLVGLVPLGAALRRGDEQAWILGLWGASSLLFVVAMIPRSWQRYYVQIYPFQAVLAGAGIAWIAARLPRAGRRRVAPGPRPPLP